MLGIVTVSPEAVEETTDGPDVLSCLVGISFSSAGEIKFGFTGTSSNSLPIANEEVKEVPVKPNLISPAEEKEIPTKQDNTSGPSVVSSTASGETVTIPTFNLAGR